MKTTRDAIEKALDERKDRSAWDKGVIIDYGGDDEPLIYPTDWAEKTSICCKDDILKAIKAEQEASENG